MVRIRTAVAASILCGFVCLSRSDCAEGALSDPVSDIPVHATLDDVREALALIPPSFDPKDTAGDPFVAAEIQRRRARRAYRSIKTLQKTALDEGARDELTQIEQELVRRMEPIVFHFLKTVITRIPDNFRGLSKDKMQELRVLVATAITEAKHFVDSYPDAKGITEGRFWLAHLLFLNNGVYLQGLINVYKKQTGERAPVEQQLAWKNTYFGQIFSLIDAVLKAPDCPPDLRQRTTKLLGDAYGNAGKRTEAARTFEEYIAKYPDAKDVVSGLIYVNAGQSYLYAVSPEQAYQVLKKGKERCDNTLYYPHIIDFYYKALTGTGRLEEAEQLWLQYLPVFSERSKDLKREESERNFYRMYAEWALFRLGYVNFALGRYERAKDFFREHLTELGKLEKLSPPAQVYMGRSQKLLDVLQNNIMKEAPPLELEGLWIRNRAFSVQENAGKVVAIIFRSYGQQRVRPVLEFLQKQYEHHGEEAGPLGVVSVAFLKGMKDVAGQLLKLEDEMKGLGMTYPGGLDPTAKRELFKAYNVNVGSATLVILDPLGRIAYYEQDPRPNAFGLFRRIFERLLKG